MIQLDPQRLHIAFTNTYKMLVDGMGIEEVLEEMDLGVVNVDILFAHDPLYPDDKEMIELMLEYFTDIEDYEKCVEIKKIL
jgi:hypothetical protein|tara:strand:- start:476 stop:718 length:243 start_codon:yes stop_codon:yes gene_type:complete